MSLILSLIVLFMFVWMLLKEGVQSACYALAGSAVFAGLGHLIYGALGAGGLVVLMMALIIGAVAYFFYNYRKSQLL